jgi:uncharacterized protein with GYD domain
MATYVILSKIGPDAFDDPSKFATVADTVAKKIKEQCPTVTWKQSYATMGRFDVVDIVDAPDAAAVEKAAMIIRGYGKSTTETLVCTPWKDFLESLRRSATAGTAKASTN